MLRDVVHHRTTGHELSLCIQVCRRRYADGAGVALFTEQIDLKIVETATVEKLRERNRKLLLAGIV